MSLELTLSLRCLGCAINQPSEALVGAREYTIGTLHRHSERRYGLAAERPFSRQSIDASTQSPTKFAGGMSARTDQHDYKARCLGLSPDTRTYSVSVFLRCSYSA